MNEHDLFKKFMDNSRKNIYDYMYIKEPTIEESDSGDTSGTTHEILNKISVMSEFIGVHDREKASDAISGYTFDDAKILEENKRISSRFSIINKYATDTSSEGFYLYIFKQYAENLHPKPIYMRIEFNHAKVGRTIQFNIPMKWAHLYNNTSMAATSPYFQDYPGGRQ
jgi:hypothetical protein